MTQEELRRFIRTLADDRNKESPLVSDSELNMFIREAEREAFERSSLGRLDSTYNIRIVQSKSTYEIDELIIFIERAKLSGQSIPLLKTTKKELDFNVPGWELQPEGIPRFYFQNDLIITLYPKPNADFTLILDGCRYPEVSMETPSHLHESLAYWALYRFYSIHDIDTEDMRRAMENRDKFDKVFGHKKPQTFVRDWKNGSAHSPLYITGF